MRSRKVEAVLVHGAVLSEKAPFFSDWASRTADHWGIVVDGYLNHLIFKLNEDRKPVGVMFESQIFRQIDEGRVTAKEEIGSTSLPLNAIKSFGESLILQFGELPDFC